MRILSGDPGKVNFAISVLEVDGKSLDLIGTRMFRAPATTLKGDVSEAVRGFMKEIRGLDNTYGPFDAVCFERFQSRGLGGDTIECISFMLGLMAQYFVSRKTPITFITASQWKNAFNRTMDLKSLYKSYAMSTKRFSKEIHEFDAMLIGIYTFCQHNNINPFSGLSSKMPLLIQKFESSSALL